MTDNTKSLIKSTILGLLGGGTASALYSLHSAKKETKSDPEFKEDEIVVPLSRRNFMRAVRSDKQKQDKPKQESKDLGAKKDYASMSQKDLMSLKKSLLRKNASCCSKGLKITTPSSAEMKIKNISGAGSTFARDKKGRFISESSIGKKAGILNDASATFNDSVGYIGGTAAGMVLLKMVSDRVLINKKKKQVEAARRRYVDALNKEVNDDDVPYYNRKTAEDERGLLGSSLGLLKLTGYATGLTAAAVIYRIMENRRKAAEKEKDKDLSKYPREKVVNYRFPKDDSFQKVSSHINNDFFNEPAPLNNVKALSGITKKAYPLTGKDKQQFLDEVDRPKLTLFRALPDRLIPSDLKGRIIINAYLANAKERKQSGKKYKSRSRKLLERKILDTPGTSRSIFNYLHGSGNKLVPELVGEELGDHWYTGPAKLLSRAPIINGIVIDKILDRTLPAINGDTSLAKRFLYAGGMV